MPPFAVWRGYAYPCDLCIIYYMPYRFQVYVVKFKDRSDIDFMSLK